ncbi:archaea-specific SMC-related protein [Natrinema gelatinilyticum]|uniref:archaea-specific SMC-related protein n=1 Tax=Natrinema gelatinilyticum TaxID=2961571 RepID=UPI0020C5339E|nr:archaea-specific SMC-related protein [Natrinema gelatinilyticum]
MSQTDPGQKEVIVDVKNVGGIDKTRVEFQPGVTVLSGRNATNRTSFLRALMVALGTDDDILKADADSGRVQLQLHGKTATRTLECKNGHVSTGGESFLDNSELADLFAFLLEDNEARRAVERGDDFREIIMRPVDTNAINHRIDQLQQEKKQISEKLGELDDLEEKKTALHQRKTRLSAEIEELKANLKAKREEIEAADRDVEETREEKAELESKLSELQSKRSELDRVKHQLETESKSIESLREEKADLEDELAELSETPAGEINEIEQRIERLRGQKEVLDSTINELRSIIRFNEDMLEDGDTAVFDAAPDGDEGGAVTDKLLDDSQTMECWTCGSTVEAGQIEETLERLKDVRKQKFEKLNGVQTEIEELQSERRAYEQQRDLRASTEDRIEAVESEIDERQERIEALRNNRDEFKTEIEGLEGEIERLEDETYSELLDLHKKANEVEFQHKQKRAEIEDIEAELDEIDDRLADRESLKAQREELKDELTDLRTRVDRIEQEAIEEFNTHIENVLDILDYGNIARIWIERREATVREERRKVDKTAFDLHLIRETEDGTSYEDTIGHLSESEREVTGLVFALAGYLVHEVYEDVPFILLDSLEAIDSDRIAALIEYLEQYADNLLVALLPEDAAALSDDYQHVTDL